MYLCIIGIYNEIYLTLQKIQELDSQFSILKLEFQLDLEKGYEQMTDNLIAQCHDLYKEKEEYSLKSKSSQGKVSAWITKI